VEVCEVAVEAVEVDEHRDCEDVLLRVSVWAMELTAAS